MSLTGALAGLLLAMVIELMKNQWLSCMNQLVSLQDMSFSGTSWGWLSTIEATVKRLTIGDGTEMGIMGYLCGIGLAIAMAYFAIAIIQMAMEDKLTPEQMLKAGAKLAISIGVIMWSPAILEGMLDFGEAFAKMFGTANFSNVTIPISGTVRVTEYDSSGLPIRTIAENYTVGNADLDTAISTYLGIFQALGIFISGAGGTIALGAALPLFLVALANITLMMLVSAIVIPIVQLCVMFIKLTRIIEIGVRGSLMPIAAGLMADDGWRGAGGRYFRKLLALSIQLGIVHLTMAITGIMINAVIVYNLVGGIYNMAFQMQYYASGEGFSSAVNSGSLNGMQTYLMGILSNCGTAFVMLIEQLCAGGINVFLGGLCVAVAGIGFMFKSLRVAEDLCGV